MEISEHIAALRREGDALASAAERVDLDRPIADCPDWRMRDLLRHVGGVHRWAAAHVGQRRPAPMDKQEEDTVMGGWPNGDVALVEWFREGHRSLVHALETADPDFAYWSFLPAPSPLAFWARRQAHETGIHRADAESAGGAVTAFPPAFAADGIDEMIFGFASRPSKKLRADPPQTLSLHDTDSGTAWLVRIGPEGAEMCKGQDIGDCAVRGAASDLYLLVWNRRTSDGLGVAGDASILDLWRQAVRIRWS